MTAAETWAGSSWAQATEPECERCHGDRIVEEPRYGRFAAEDTRPIRCPACSTGKPLRSAS